MRQILCFGDSNTWGYIPVTKQRYEEGIRWTSILQEKLTKDAKVIEEGLCGRTTVYEDEFRPNRKGIDSISQIMNSNGKVDQVVLMLGTNDCKKIYHNSAQEIATGIEKCVDELLRYVSREQILLVSPIHLGEEVWKEGFDPDFDVYSVGVSKELKREYAKLAKRKKLTFLAASDYARPSKEDQEHLDVKGHKKLADAIYTKLNEMESLAS